MIVDRYRKWNVLTAKSQPFLILVSNNFPDMNFIAETSMVSKRGERNTSTKTTAPNLQPWTTKRDTTSSLKQPNSKAGNKKSIGPQTWKS